MLLDSLPAEIRSEVEKKRDKTRELHLIPKSTKLETLKKRYVEEMKIINDLEYSEVIEINGRKEGRKIFADHYRMTYSRKKDFYRMIRNNMDVVFEDKDWIIFQRKYS